MSNVTFTLRPRPPFRLDLTVWTLRRRADNRIDQWDGRTYRRALALQDATVGVTVIQAGTPEAPELRVSLSNADAGSNIQQQVTQILKRLLGLEVDLSAFYTFAATDPKLAPLADRFRGFKPPRFPTLFEALVNAIACQQITLTQGIRLLNRLAERYGVAMDAFDPPLFTFPTPQAVATSSPDTLRDLGLSHQKREALIALAAAVHKGHLLEQAFNRFSDEAAIDALCELKGIGRWSAEYALLRGLGRTHIFPGDDVGARKHLQHWLEISEPLNYQGVREVLRPWRPYGGLIYFQLLLEGLAEAGYVQI